MLKCYSTLQLTIVHPIRAPFLDAINSAGISKPEIEQVVLFGGGTRIPKIQEQILKATEQ